MAEIYKRVIQDIEDKRERVLSGEVNCLPSPFKRYRDTWPGIEQGKYLIVTANVKIGKTQIADEIALYNSFIYAFEHRDKIRVKIFYFTLEMSKEKKYRQFMCYLLYRLTKGKIRIDPQNLRSINEEKPLPVEILDILKSEEFVEYYNFFEENVVFIDDIRNPTGIYQFCAEYAIKNGIQHKKKVVFKDGEERELDDYYEQEDKEEYRIVIVDHYRLLKTERGLTLRDTIDLWSSRHAIALRDKYNYTIVGIQQQAAAQEGNENAKLGKLKPTLDGLGECKTTQQDADLVIGLFSPFRHQIREYEGYNINKFRDHIRFMEVLAGRDGGGGDICPLYFDGAVNFFKELPLPDDVEGLERVYKLMESYNNGYYKQALLALVSRVKIHWLERVNLNIRRCLRF